MSVSLTKKNTVVAQIGEAFRQHGFDGASLTVISQSTGLGRSSLYNYFPGGKEQMAAAVLKEAEQWFETNILEPLRSNDDVMAAINVMFSSINTYFHQGHSICLLGAFALDQTRDKFSSQLQDYFKAWIDTLSLALSRKGLANASARQLSLETVAFIQGALVLARAMDQPNLFVELTHAQHQRLLTALRSPCTT